jgi:hypothetical protein
MSACLNTNNKYAFYAGSSPFKPNTMAQGSMTTNAKHVYVKKGGYGQNSSDSSVVIAQKRRIAIGKNTTRLGIQQENISSYASGNKNTVNSAIARVRGGGSVAPPKKGMIK